MDIEQVAPELREAVARTPNISFEGAGRRALIQAVLSLLPSSKTQGVKIEQRRIHGAHMRLYLPSARRSPGALLWIHGGGFIIGRAKQDDRICGRTAAALGIPVISAEYRLAPKHPFPAALDDVGTIWSWLLDAARSLEIDNTRIAIGGESAGGGLAAALVQRIYDEGGVQPCAQWLISPMLDDRTAANADLDAIGNFVWDNAQNRFGWRSYLGSEPGAASLAEYAAPARRHDLSGLPRALIGVGDIDLFFEEDRVYAERLGDAGVEAKFIAVAGGPHGFEAWAPDNPVSVAFLAEAVDWLNRVLDR